MSPLYQSEDTCFEDIRTAKCPATQPASKQIFLSSVQIFTESDAMGMVKLGHIVFDVKRMKANAFKAETQVRQRLEIEINRWLEHTAV